MRRPITDAQRQRIRIIIDEVCRQFKLTEEAAFGPSHSQASFLPRIAIATALRKFVGISLPLIGDIMGGRNHSTVVHAIRMGEKSGWLPECLALVEQRLVLHEQQIEILNNALQVASIVVEQTPPPSPHGIELYGDNGVAW